MMARPPAIFLMGPTAAGKTDLALRLVRELPVEIISVDSAMVFKGMDIGTAKPDAALLAEAPHRLIDFLDPAESYSAARFRADALAHMQEIRAAGRIPLLAGGTMLYFRTLLQGLSPLPEADPRIRAELEARAAAEGWPALHAELAAVDPVAAERLHPNDAQRIQRALEVYRLSGRPLSELQRGGTDDLPWDVLQLAVAPAERAELHERIAQRFRQMLEQGLLEEVKALRARPDLHLGLPAMRAVGYRQLWLHLDGAWDLAEATERGIAATRQLAKRQLTWLRGNAEVRWLDSGRPGMEVQALGRVRAFLEGPGAA